MDDTRERVFINIQQKPPSPDKFCREVRMSMLIFLPVTEENLSFRGKVPPPPWSPCFRQRGLSASLACNQTLRNISASGRLNIWGLYWFPLRGGGGWGHSELSYISCDCPASVSDGCLQKKKKKKTGPLTKGHWTPPSPPIILFKLPTRTLTSRNA